MECHHLTNSIEGLKPATSRVFKSQVILGCGHPAHCLASTLVLRWGGQSLGIPRQDEPVIVGQWRFPKSWGTPQFSSVFVGFSQLTSKIRRWKSSWFSNVLCLTGIQKSTLSLRGTGQFHRIKTGYFCDFINIINLPNQHQSTQSTSYARHQSTSRIARSQS